MTLPPLRVAPLAVLVGAGALLYVGAVLWSGSAETMDAIARLGAGTMVLGTLVASCAYAVRFVRWHVLLAGLGHNLPAWFNLRVYLSGLALTSTPGKLGETFRSILLLDRGVGIPHSLAAFFADRLSDVIGVALLGAIAGRLAATPLPALEILAVAAFVGALVARGLIQTRWWSATLARLDRSGLPGRVLAVLTLPASAWACVWTAPRSVFYAGCAVLAYGLQALVFAGYLQAAGAPLAPAHAVSIFASSTFVGAASMIPGGLGAMEASLVYQLLGAGVPKGPAIAATIAARASTLWFSMLLGSAMLLTLPAGAEATANRRPGDRRTRTD